MSLDLSVLGGADVLALHALSARDAAAATQIRQQASDPAQAARTLEAQGYRAWYAEIFGQSFVDAWAKHHEEAIAWHWNARQSLLKGERPDYDAYFAIWSRGHMKSTIARRLAIADAALSVSAGVGGYCLYVGGSEKKTNSHALSVGKLLELPTLARYYPKLTRVMKSQEGFSRGAGRDFRYTEAGYVFHFGSLDAGLAGGNVDDVRPTLIIPDDIDERGSSAEVYTNRAVRFTTELLPMRQSNTLVFNAQNLIQRNTIQNQIYTGKITALANRFPTQPIPAVENLVTESVQLADGRNGHRFISGRITWHGWDAQRVQDEINTMGLEAFLLECQHEVNARKTGRVLHAFDPSFHVISWSQFRQAYRLPEGAGIPNHWDKHVGHDWGNTHPNVISAVAVAAENSRLPGLKFLFYGQTMPLQPTVDDVALKFIEQMMPGVDTRRVRSLTGEDYQKWINPERMGDVLNAPREIARQQLRPQVAAWLEGRRFVSWAASHEQKNIREIYNTVYGLPFWGVNPGADGGVSEINAAFQIDFTVPDPFRSGQMGYAGFYLIVDDDQLIEPRDDRGLKLWREQFLDWSMRETRETPTGLTDDKPQKIHDDTGNTLMMVWVHSQNLCPAPLTYYEKIERAIAPDLPEVTHNHYHTIRSILEKRTEKEWQQREDAAFSDGLNALMKY